jgi:hypothetical protein
MYGLTTRNTYSPRYSLTLIKYGIQASTAIFFNLWNLKKLISEKTSLLLEGFQAVPALSSGNSAV